MKTVHLTIAARDIKSTSLAILNKHKKIYSATLNLISISIYIRPISSRLIDSKEDISYDENLILLLAPLRNNLYKIYDHTLLFMELLINLNKFYILLLIYHQYSIQMKFRLTHYLRFGPLTYHLGIMPVTHRLYILSKHILLLTVYVMYKRFL